MSSFIPVNEPLLAGKEKQYLNECIDSGWISSEGPFVQKFEENFALAVGRVRASQRLLTIGQFCEPPAVWAFQVIPVNQNIAFPKLVRYVYFSSLLPFAVRRDFGRSASSVERTVSLSNRRVSFCRTLGRTLISRPKPVSTNNSFSRL